MSEHSIVIRRDDGVEGFCSTQSVGTDALNAMQSIPGVEDPQIVSETDEQAEITFEWVGDGQFWRTEEHLSRFGLKRASA
jgi:hypothetical protein